MVEQTNLEKFFKRNPKTIYLAITIVSWVWIFCMDLFIFFSGTIESNLFLLIFAHGYIAFFFILTCIFYYLQKIGEVLAILFSGLIGFVMFISAFLLICL